MANLQAITKTEFSEKTWQRFTSYLFAANDSVCPLTAQELPQAMMGVPIGFILVDDVYKLRAVQGLQSNSNFYVDAAGQWLGKYVPMTYRCHPFLLAKNEMDEDQLVFCVDTDSGLVTEQSGSEIFFDEEGELSETLSSVFDLLVKTHGNLSATNNICKSLQELDLFKPWEIEIPLATGSRQINGLHCIDEEALKNLSDEAFLTLRQSGALSVAYCQMLSMQHISELIHLAKIKAESAAKSSSPELNFDSITDSGNISFDNL